MISQSAKDRAIYITEVIFQQILAIFCVIILWELFSQSNYDFSTKRTWHILLCVFGFALCMAEGVQIFRKESIVTVGNNRLDKAMAHLIVMCVAFLSITIGISLKISEKSDLNREHFNSTHGILGLSSWIIAFVTALGGVIVKNSDRLNIGRPSLFKFVHILFGVSAYVLGIVSLGYGLHYLLVIGSNRIHGRDFLIALMSIYVSYSLIGPCLSLFHFMKK
ncbi:unnamed protein product [Phaedon cochleariae]|uniref:ascorbate ferrireductase (transmembrane) n=1 Tax=Phaedon cochleariae TaxID=80249 RepID=A0A9N9X3P3_PHACE|nr:unnamed protein product [Phaedon cochleariae]